MPSRSNPGLRPIRRDSTVKGVAGPSSDRASSPRRRQVLTVFLKLPGVLFRCHDLMSMNNMVTAWIRRAVRRGRRHRGRVARDRSCAGRRAVRRRLRAGDGRHAAGSRSGGLADVAPHPRRVGLQPAGPGDAGERRRDPARLVARPDGRHAGGDAAGLRRRALHAERQRRHPGHRRGERRPAVGVPPRPAGGRLRVRRRQRPQHAEHRHLRPAHHQRQRRRLRLRARRGDRRDRLGDADLRLPGDTGRPQFRSDHRRRPGDLRAKLPAARRAGIVRRGGARRADRRGAVAAADGAGPGRAGRRDLGRRALRGAGARRLLDAGQLRPRAAADLPGHLGHLAGAQVPARRGGEQAPVPQLDAGPRRRDGRDSLVLPAPERPLGSRPSLRAAARRHRGGAGPRRGELDQPAHPAGRGAQGRHRRAGQDRPRLHPRPRDGRVPVGDGRPWRRT